MRIKIESAPPLPPLKAWFIVHSASTVSELKSVLAADLPSFRDDHVQGEDLTLTLEDFELLDSSTVDVIRDGDLITIKRSSHGASNKRKASTSHGESPIRKRTKRDSNEKSQLAHLRTASHKPATSTVALKSERGPVYSKSQSESSSSSSSDSESDSSTSSNSDSDSDSSSSDSSSTSSSSGVPSVAPSRPGKGVPASAPSRHGASPSKEQRTVSPTKTPTTLIPPGLGKPTTHSRNVRRRRKKMYERLAQTTEPASVNEIPLGTRARTPELVQPEPSSVSIVETPESIVPQQARVPPVFMMSTLQNKNKRKGFKHAMLSGVAPKIVFADADDAATAQSEEAITQESTDFIQTDRSAARMVEIYPRLIPPSEKQESGQLPPNLFVTSIDVEEGIHPKRKKKKQAQTWDYDEYVEADAVVLPYDDAEGAGVIVKDSSHTDDQVPRPAPLAWDHASISARWDSFPKVTERSQLQPAAIVGWKALGINYATLTPEVLLTTGCVISCNEQLIVKPFAEASVAEVSFGGAVETEEVGAIEETFEWSDVMEGDWRIITGY